MQTESKGSKITSTLSKLLKIENLLQGLEYTKIFQDLLDTHVFYFDLHQVVNDTSIQPISKLCTQFFKFLLFRIVYLQTGYQDQFTKVKQQRVLSHNKNRQAIRKANEPVDRNQNGSVENKSRANTTIGLASRKSLKLRFNVLKREEKQITANSMKQNKDQKLNSNNRSDLEDVGHEQMTCKLIEANRQLKQAYFLLNQSINNRNRVFKIQIVCFLIAMISPALLHLLMANLQSPDQSGRRRSKQPSGECYSVEQQVYIVLTYQTLGNLVSPKVFHCLHKKYIKHQIFQTYSNEQYDQLIRSLKHIKQNLKNEKNVVLIKSRKHRQKLNHLKPRKVEAQNEFSKENLKSFIRQVLRNRENKDSSMSSLKHIVKEQNILNNQVERKKDKGIFYPFFEKHKSRRELSVLKQSKLPKNSLSIKQKLNINSQDKRIKRKCIKGIQNTFYKFKSNHNRNGHSQVQQDKPSLKNIKSERSSYKFNRINLQTTQVASKRNSIQFMRTQAQKFKSEAIKDLQTIQMFKQAISFQWARRDCIFSENKISRLQNITQDKLSSDQLLSGNSGNEGRKIINMKSLENQKQQVWHEMYNIRDEVVPNPVKIVQQAMTYKLSKNSDKLRKFRQVFEQDCQKRIDLLEPNIDLVGRMRINAK